jgi:hypothetical protein
MTGGSSAKTPAVPARQKVRTALAPMRVTSLAAGIICPPGPETAEKGR